MCVRFYQVWFGASDEKLDQSDPNYEAEVDTEIIGGALMAYTIITPLVSQHTGGFFSPKEGKIIILFFCHFADPPGLRRRGNRPNPPHLPRRPLQHHRRLRAHRIGR